VRPFRYITHAVLTDVGKKRKTNEDAFAVFPEHGFFCVADGMGGAEDGEIASGAVRDWLEKLFARFDPTHPLSIRAKVAWIDSTFNEVSNWVYQRAKERGKTGTGSTVVGVAFDPASPSSVVALHAGDSRVYHWSAEHSHFTLVTIDHSVANAVGLADERRLNPAFRNMLMRAVGLGPSVQVEETPFQVVAGDWVVVCSDGLSKMMSDDKIAAHLTAASDPNAAAQSLVNAALAAGGRDNVTVVAIRIGDLPEPLSEADLNAEMPVFSAMDGTDPTTSSTETHITEQTQTPLLQEVPTLRRTWVLLWCIAIILFAALVFSGVANWLSQQAGEPPTESPTPRVEALHDTDARLKEKAEKLARDAIENKQ